MKKTACVWINIEGTYDITEMTKQKRMKILENLRDIGKERKVDQVIISLYTGGSYTILRENLDTMIFNVNELNDKTLKLGKQLCANQYLDIEKNKIIDIPEEIGYFLGDKMKYFEEEYENVTEVIVFDDYPDAIPLSYLKHEEIRDLIRSGKRRFTVVDKYGRGKPITEEISHIDCVNYKVMKGEYEFLLYGSELLLEEAKELNK